MGECIHDEKLPQFSREPPHALKSGLAATAFASLPAMMHGETAGPTRMNQHPPVGLPLVLQRHCTGSALRLRGLDRHEGHRSSISRMSGRFRGAMDLSAPWGRRAVAPFPMRSTGPRITPPSRQRFALTFRWRQRPACPTSLPFPESPRHERRRRRAQHHRGPEPREKDRRRQRRDHLHGAAEQQGQSSRLHVRPHGVGRARDGGSELAQRETALRHLPHADYGGRSDRDHPRQPPVDRPLSHRRRARPSRTRQHAGSTMGRSHAGHCRCRLQRLCGARICSRARPADQPARRRGSVATCSGPRRRRSVC